MHINCAFSITCYKYDEISGKGGHKKTILYPVSDTAGIVNLITKEMAKMHQFLSAVFSGKLIILSKHL